MSKNHKKHTQQESSPSEREQIKIGQILMGLAGFKRTVEDSRLIRIADAFMLCSDFPELFAEVPLTRFVGMFLDEEAVKYDVE